VKADEKENFLARWSRLKREQPVEKQPETPAPALPPVEKLTPESDFSGFMHPKVKDELRRVALKKLFGDPHFKAVDPFEPYSIDLTGGEAIPPEMLAGLNQARTILFREEEEKKAAQNEAPDDAAESKQEELKQDEPRRQDT
jgi:Protein of unknown function (DUF3306)